MSYFSVCGVRACWLTILHQNSPITWCLWTTKSSAHWGKKHHFSAGVLFCIHYCRLCFSPQMFSQLHFRLLTITNMFLSDWSEVTNLWKTAEHSWHTEVWLSKGKRMSPSLHSSHTNPLAWQRYIHTQTHTKWVRKSGFHRGYTPCTPLASNKVAIKCLWPHDKTATSSQIKRSH